MLIIQDTTGITIKRRIQDSNHVRIGVTQTAMWLMGARRFVRENGKPHCEFTLNECEDLLKEMEYQERMVA